MARPKGEIDIGFRAAKEVERLAAAAGLHPAKLVRKIGLDRRNYSRWGLGDTPGSYALQALTMAGADPCYILTGRRSYRE